MNEFPAIVDKVQITIYTNDDDVQQWYPKAQAAYLERDQLWLITHPEARLSDAEKQQLIQGLQKTR